ncbi:MAG: FAD-dependent oxidoreductase, partial [Spirulinaceae cyanobacterium RM2_2_10]|nr:FAD-dependent oxidoreductase [Spirulinaceae cyanobacterium RM2_2_10]
ERLRLVLLQAGDRLLARWPEALSRYTAQHLSRLGIEVRCQARVAAIGPQRVELATGEAIAAATIVWTGGLVANAPATQPEITTLSSGQWPVEPSLQLADHPEVYAVGDLAAVKDQESLPNVAPVAMQMGSAAAANLQRQLRGRSPQPFHYYDKGRAAIIARYAGLVKTERLQLQGWLGWLLWLLIHVGYLPGWRNQLAVLGAWLGDLVGRPRSLQRLDPQPYRRPRSATIEAMIPDQ